QQLPIRCARAEVPSLADAGIGLQDEARALEWRTRFLGRVGEHDDLEALHRLTPECSQRPCEHVPALPGGDDDADVFWPELRHRSWLCGTRPRLARERTSKHAEQTRRLLDEVAEIPQ